MPGLRGQAGLNQQGPGLRSLAWLTEGREKLRSFPELSGHEVLHPLLHPVRLRCRVRIRKAKEQTKGQHFLQEQSQGWNLSLSLWRIHVPGTDHWIPVGHLHLRVSHTSTVLGAMTSQYARHLRVFSPTLCRTSHAAPLAYCMASTRTRSQSFPS